MPFLFGAGFLGGTLFTIGSLTVTVGQVIGLLTSVAFIAVASALTDQNIPDYQSFDNGVNSNIKQANAYRKYIYGRRKTNALFAARATWGNNSDPRVGKTVNNDNQVRALIIGDGPLEAVEELYLLNELVTLDDEGFPTNERYKDSRIWMWVNPFLGSKDQDFRSVRPEHFILSARVLKTTPLLMGNIYTICARLAAAHNVDFNINNITIQALDRNNPNPNINLRTFDTNDVFNISPTGNITGRFWLMTGVFPANTDVGRIGSSSQIPFREVESHYNNRRRVWGNPPTLLFAEYDDGFYYPIQIHPAVPRGYLTPYIERLSTRAEFGFSNPTTPSGGGLNVNKLEELGGYGMRTISDADALELYKQGVGTLQGSTRDTSSYLAVLKEVDTGGLVLDSMTGDIYQTSPVWSDPHKLQGIAYMLVYGVFDTNVLDAFPEGFPRASVVVRGLKDIYDPRRDPLVTMGLGPGTDPRHYSANPMLGMVHYCEREMSIDNNEEWDIEEMKRAADECDEEVPIGEIDPDTGFQEMRPRYEIGAAVSSGDTHEQNLSIFLNAMDAQKIFRDLHTGKYRVYPGLPRQSTFTITPDMIRIPIKRRTQIKRRDRINEVRGSYRSEENDWQLTEYPIVSDPAAIVRDNNQVLSLNWDLEGVTNPYQARQLATQKLRKGLLYERVNFSIGPQIRNVKPGLPVTVQFPNNRYPEKVYMVEDVVENTLKHKNALNWSVSLSEYDADYIYDFNPMMEDKSSSITRQSVGVLQRGGTEQPPVEQEFSNEAIWRLSHNFDIEPNVELLDENGKEFDADIQHEAGEVIVTMGAAYSGKIVLSL